MVIALKSHNIAYMAVPKAACTSIKAGLALIDPDVDLSLEAMTQDNMLIHQAYPTMRYRPLRWLEYENYWRFTVVRDPIKRLMSVYTDIVATRDVISNSRKLRRDDTPLPINPDPDFFYQNLAGYMQQASVIKHHSLPVWLFIGPLPLIYDRIYRIEDIGELAEDLTKRCGEPVSFPRLNSSSLKLGLEDLKPKTRAALQDYLLKEYETLEGIYDNPL